VSKLTPSRDGGVTEQAGHGAATHEVVHIAMIQDDNGVEAGVAGVDYSVLPYSLLYVKVLIHGGVVGNGDTKGPSEEDEGKRRPLAKVTQFSSHFK
jgi:hypothetical protein